MPRRTKDELLAEFRRIGAIFDTWRDFEIARASPERAASLRRNVRSSEEALAEMGPGGATLSSLIEGHQIALNDICEQLGHGIEANKPEARDFLAFYRERTGRDWWDDAGDPAKRARKILKRGRIRNATEWYLLENILTNVDQTIFSHEEVVRLNAMRLRFEESHAAR